MIKFALAGIVLVIAVLDLAICKSSASYNRSREQEGDLF